MTVEIDRIDDNHSEFRLGRMEKLVMAGAAGLLVFLMGWTFHNFDNRLETQADKMQMVLVQQAVTNAQLLTLTQQLSDVPSLTQKAAEMTVRIDRNTQDIKDLQSVRGLRR